MRRMLRHHPRTRVFFLFRQAILAGMAALAIVSPASARQGEPVPDVLASVDADAIEAHLRFLSHDLLGGRAPGTRGDRLAILYVESEFRRMGLQPALHGSYLLPVPLVARRFPAATTLVEFFAGGREVSARPGDDVVLWAPAADTVDVFGEVVFAGFGIYAPEYGWDDFGQTDVRGKILLVLPNEPPPTPDAPTRFDGRALTYYGRWTYKVEEAARRGAAGVLIMHSRDAGYPWSVVLSTWGGEQLHPRNAPATLQVEGWVTAEYVDGLLAAAGLDRQELIRRALGQDFQPIHTGIRADIQLRGRSRLVDAYNTAGLLPGSDPDLRDEAVVYTAHLDGLGTGAPVAGDSIYNGAYDNASGVAAMLEIADAFTRLERRPDRSILFVATTAEEAGLLGAREYLRAPVFPLDRTVLAINLDGANLWGETDDAVVLGIERSPLRAAVEDAARALGLRLVPDRAPELGRLFRSDAFAFASAGVPALQVEHGVEFRGRSLAWSAGVVRQYADSDYHRPSDEYHPGFDLSGAVQQAKLAFLIGFRAAQE